MSENNDAEKRLHSIFDDYLNAYKQTSKAQDETLLDIALHKQDYVNMLDKMWANYLGGCYEQIVNYNKQVDYLKQNGYKVLRNSQGKHRIELRGK